MGGRGIKVEIMFFHVFTMIPLAAGQAKQPLLKDWIFSVPQRQGKTETLMPVANPGYAIFIPAIGTGASVIMGKVVPGLARWAVVFAHCAPGPLADIWAPALPVGNAISRFFQAQLFRGHEYLRSTSFRLAMQARNMIVD